jgi:hypothetical protein
MKLQEVFSSTVQSQTTLQMAEIVLFQVNPNMAYMDIGIRQLLSSRPALMHGSDA